MFVFINMVIEVEAKVSISKLDDLRAKLRKITRFIGREKKADDYYTLQNLAGYPTKSLRVRARKNYHEVNFKQPLSYSNGVWAKNEVEFKIHDLNGFFELLNEFGFRKWLRKEKQTELYKSGNVGIEINKVKGLGWFMEVEYLCNKKNIAKARKKVVDVLKKLNINKKDIEKSGYTKMLWKKMH